MAHRRLVLLVAIALLGAATIWFAPSDLTSQGRLVLIVLLLAILGWAATPINDTAVAVGAALALVVSGAIDSKDLYGALGHELIWLLIAAFIMAAVLRASGMVEPLLLSVSRLGGTVSRLFYLMTGAIAATAVFIPSTSARAALLLPVFVLLAERIASKRVVRALSLLFPTIILLSAAGSLTGAGAHLLAAEILREKSQRAIDVLDWMILAMPIALISSFAATAIILRVFLSPAERRRRVVIEDVAVKQPEPRSRAIVLVMAGTVATWIAQPLHGFGMGIVALAGAFAMLCVAGPLLKPKQAFKAVEVELIVFLALTYALANAMISTGVDTWLAARLSAVVPGLASLHQGFVVAAVAAIALSSHLVITSRTARAAVLFPAVVLPVAGLGGDITVLALTVIVGTGLCQTLPASAKPVAIFANAPVETYRTSDLVRLSAYLMPMMFVLILVFASLYWPQF
ncbi:MAG: SLC13 family permease [Hyphomicrobiaceae bacterium]